MTRIEESTKEARRLLAEAISASGHGNMRRSIRLLSRAQTTLGVDPRGNVSTPYPLDDSVSLEARREQQRLAARVLLSLAFPLHELGREEASMEVLDSAQRIGTAEDLLDINALVYAQRGATLLRAGRVNDALRQLDQAAAIREYAPPLDQCKILLNRSLIRSWLGALTAAEEDCRTALRVAEEHGIPDVAFGAAHNLGMLAYLAGDLTAALGQIPQTDLAPSDFERGVAGVDRAKVLLSAGLSREADEALLDACEALKRTDMTHFYAEAELARAEVALVVGNNALALELSTSALRKLRKRNNRRSSSMAELVRLRAQAALGRSSARIAAMAERLAPTFRELQMPDQSVISTLMSMAYGPGGATSQRLRFPPISRSHPIEVRLFNRLVRARLAYARGDVSYGRRQARLGLAELSTYQAQFGSLDLQTSSAAHGVELARLAIAEEIRGRHAASVIDWLERARAISGRIAPVHPPADPIEADLLAQLRWVLSQLEQPAEERAYGIADLRRRRALLESQIRTRTWSLQGPQTATRIPTLTQIRDRLGDAVLVDIFELDHRVHAVVATRRRCWLEQLGPSADIRELVRRLSADLDVLAMTHVPEPLRMTARRSLRAGFGRIDAMILQPLHLPSGPVVVLPPASLAALPWGQLPSLVGRPVTVASSAGSWLAAAEGLEQLREPVVAIAGPGLVRADEEVEAVVATWPGCTPFTGPAATGRAIVDAIDGARLVHVAAHGKHERDSPLFSSIKLFDGPLVGYDLDRLRRPPQQVVLSACDLGQATVRPGDEALGLTRALLHSGTSTVISGVAKVSDRGAADLMVDYHGRLAAGSPPAYALADSLAAADEPMPFVCFGAGW